MSRRYHSGEVVKAFAAQTAKATEELRFLAYWEWQSLEAQVG
jgi:hypothetical protein